jgi:hypothetical protein
LLDTPEFAKGELAVYRELVGKRIEGHNWARLQEPCPEKNIMKAEKEV